ncbi:hypothetical protein K402DRAFT_421443 [Aulographum hederae CBS 113979]|uniref:Uncharacterized protein n=1 Tax=Aulographum hederae CBS 113979 TaxID=1176131 RepID=A0A6G1GZJ4_9PEZI|nr:hypothetical protein K402DRAFT_421443 [Aulographum hederae CBS 113979]
MPKGASRRQRLKGRTANAAPHTPVAERSWKTLRLQNAWVDIVRDGTVEPTKSAPSEGRAVNKAPDTPEGPSSCLGSPTRMANMVVHHSLAEPSTSVPQQTQEVTTIRDQPVATYHRDSPHPYDRITHRAPDTPPPDPSHSTHPGQRSQQSPAFCDQQNGHNQWQDMRLRDLMVGSVLDPIQNVRGNERLPYRVPVGAERAAWQGRMGMGIDREDDFSREYSLAQPERTGSPPLNYRISVGAERAAMVVGPSRQETRVDETLRRIPHGYQISGPPGHGLAAAEADRRNSGAAIEPDKQTTESLDFAWQLPCDLHTTEPADSVRKAIPPQSQGTDTASFRGRQKKYGDERVDVA